MIDTPRRPPDPDAPPPGAMPPAHRTPEPSFGTDEEGDVPPAKDNDRAAWVREAE